MNARGNGLETMAGPERMLRVGVIGAGVMGTNHARVLAGLPDIGLVGVVDPLPAHRTRATDFTGCRTFEDLDELLAEGVDAVRSEEHTSELQSRENLVCRLLL